MICDIIIIAVIAVFAVIGAKRGFAKSLLNAAGLVAAIIASRYLSELLAGWIYQTFVREQVILNLEQMISQNGALYTIDNSVTALPGWLQMPITLIAALFGSDIHSISRSLSFSSESVEVMAKAIEEPLGGFATGILAFLLSLLFFAVLLIIIKLLIKAVLVFFKLPVIRQLNAFLGCLLGIVEGFAVSWLAINLFYVIMTYTNPVVLESSLVSGYIFRFMCLSY